MIAKVGFLCIVLPILFAVSCSPDGKSSEEDSVLGVGELRFERQIIDVHAEPGQSTVSVEFPFKVEGGSSLVSAIDAPCECLGVNFTMNDVSVDLPHRWVSGDSGKVVAKFRTTGFRGVVSKQIFVAFDRGVEPLVLTVRLHVPEIIEITPNVHKWTLGKLETKSFQVKVNHSASIHITSLSCNDPAFHCEVVTVEEGREYRIDVIPQGVASKKFGILTVKTDCQFQAYARHNVFLQVEAEAGSEKKN